MKQQPDYVGLLVQALTEPGKLSSCYAQFHGYSLLNNLLALEQLTARGLEVGPITTFKKWKELGRNVKKGEKAISLFIPLTKKSKTDKALDEEKDNKDATDEATVFCGFAMVPRWFVLSQTEGADYEEKAAPGWDKVKALAALGVEEVPFRSLDGNCQGYASGKSVAVNPVAALPHKTMFHELGHVVLGHTTQDAAFSDVAVLPRSLKEAEAEGVAYLCIASLGLDGLPESRGYIQHWLAEGGLKELDLQKYCQRVISAAGKILAAGKPDKE